MPGETLLFLDEIQACTPALAAPRYFFEHVPELHVVAAGSLLDFALREFSHSMPVGRIEFLHLHPMSFEEFLEVVEGAPLVEYLGQRSLSDPPTEAVEGRLRELLRRYFFVGGMPEAVRAYVERNDLLEVQRIQSALVQTFQEDFAKYGPRRLQELMRRTYSHVATNVGRKLNLEGIHPGAAPGADSESLRRPRRAPSARWENDSCCSASNARFVFVEVPVGDYQLGAQYGHFRIEEKTEVKVGVTNRLRMQPLVGGLRIVSEPASADFSLAHR